MSSGKKLKGIGTDVHSGRNTASGSVSDVVKRKLDVELIEARTKADATEKVKALCQVAVTAKSLGLDAVSILEQSEHAVDLVDDKVERGILLMGIGGFYKMTGNDPLPILARSVTELAESPASRLRDEVLIKVARVFTQLNEFDLAQSTVEHVSDANARKYIRDKIDVEKERHLSAN